MVLEAVMVCVDNSDYTRNGDYMPSRFESQSDAVNLICGAKTNQNPENSVGILCSAGDRIEVMITPTADLGRIVSELNKIVIGGSSDLLRAIQTAQLALKHRQNKKQRQRIIAFVGSPISATDKELETLGKNLKKNSVALDLVSFGEVEENAPKLEKLMNALNSTETSHMLEIPVGPKLLSDVLISSPIVNPDGEGMGGGADGAGFEFGVNPETDPELALALRISMEEERARQGATAGGDAAPAADAAAAAPAGGDAPAPAATAAPAAPAAPASNLPAAPDAAIIEAMGMEDMDDELRQALLLSMQEAGPPPAAAPAAAADVPMTDAAPAAPAAAAPAQPATGSSGEAPKDADMGAEALDSKWFQDPSFVQELLGSLPGVDINDPRIQSALKEVGGDEEKKDEKDKDGSSGGDKGSSSGSK
eukprot:TRINITY_DN4966_c0_g1_i1.p1 TRINITY_DN4966_c0_g1~~TRINITY_DN4966_c0_g1_i1.p1  ORF type:complete len:421 (-),score=163.21 TRINITY_DN4966_c0_g1_i1:78-1340(-)